MTTSSWRVVSALAMTAALVVPLGAHMRLTKSSPAADSTVTTSPKAIQIWFTEPPDLAVSKIELASADGTLVKLGAPHTMPDKSLMASTSTQMGDGTYTVRWQSAGNDGHVLKGEYTFRVRRAE